MRAIVPLSLTVFASALAPGSSVTLTSGQEQAIVWHQAFTLTSDNNKRALPFSRGVKLPSIKATFLPAGWPQSVPEEYLAYQQLNCLQDACSYLRSVLATKAILAGMGVGNAETTATAATVMWFLRDGFGMLGGLIFASGSSLEFGPNSKQWRIFADGINNVGITLEVLAPVFSAQKSIFFFLLSVASICKSLCGVAAGATNSAIGEHWGSKRGNFAEIASKNGIQHTAVSLLCLLVSVPFIRLTGSVNTATTWLIYGVLTAAHMIANLAAMRMLALRSLNYNRLSILIGRFLTLRADGAALAAEQVAALMSPAAVARIDPLLLWSCPREALPQAGFSVLYLAPLKTLLKECEPSAIIHSVALYTNQGYILAPSRNSRTVIVSMKESVVAGGGEDQVKALFEAHRLRQALSMMQEKSDSVKSEQALADLLQRVRTECDAEWGLFWSTLQRLDWDTTRLQLQPPKAATIHVS